MPDFLRGLLGVALLLPLTGLTAWAAYRLVVRLGWTDWTATLLPGMTVSLLIAVLLTCLFDLLAVSRSIHPLLSCLIVGGWFGAGAGREANRKKQGLPPE